MTWKICDACGTAMQPAEQCVHCGHRGATSSLSRAAILLGLVGCGDGGLFDTEPEYQALYGAPDTGYVVDNDGDGFSEEEGDCNDSDDTVFPGATETPGDGVDSNCKDGDDA